PGKEQCVPAMSEKVDRGGIGQLRGNNQVRLAAKGQCGGDEDGCKKNDKRENPPEGFFELHKDFCSKRCLYSSGRISSIRRPSSFHRGNDTNLTGRLQRQSLTKSE